MPESEQLELVAFVAANPQAGDLIPEAGGVRKLRWALSGRGKRSGARVIYYFHSEQIQTGLKVTAYLDRHYYPCGLKPTPAQLASLR